MARGASRGTGDTGGRPHALRRPRAAWHPRRTDRMEPPRSRPGATGTDGPRRGRGAAPRVRRRLCAGCLPPGRGVRGAGPLGPTAARSGLALVARSGGQPWGPRPSV